MAEETETSTQDDSYGEQETSRIHVLDDLADRLAKIEAMLSGSRKPAAPARTAKPESIEAQVRAELERRDREKADAEKAEKDKSERESLAQRLAKLEERPPAEPSRRATRSLGWGK